MADKKYLLDLNLGELEKLAVEELGLPAFRGRQLYQWLYVKEAAKFSEMTDLSKGLRQLLSEKYYTRVLKEVEKNYSPESGTTKFLFELEDGRRVESVWIPDGKRKTICISSQVGCALKCEFCQTGRMGFIRDLSPGEIIEQVLRIRWSMGEANTNVVFMGMGEPFLNYDNVIKAAGIMTDDKGLSLANRKVTISTAGIVPRIRQFTAEKHKMRLAISLNHSNNEEREWLMPITKKYSLTELMAAAKEWALDRKDRITFEYVLIKGVNDGKRNAEELVKLVEDVPCKINVIPLNSGDEGMRPPADERVEEFMRWLSKSRWMITLRRPRGRDINAACGMLYAKNENNKLLRQYHFETINR
jgi:23S rRNA (adenine2503-C2)-methyltransferase